jgi:hypothetical protein
MFIGEIAVQMTAARQDRVLLPPVGAAPLSRLLLCRRIRRGNDADRDDPAPRLRLRRTDTHLGASGAIAAVMGAYFVLYPDSRISTLVLWFPVRIPAWFFLGGWFLYQFFEGNYGLITPPTRVAVVSRSSPTSADSSSVRW